MICGGVTMFFFFFFFLYFNSIEKLLLPYKFYVEFVELLFYVHGKHLRSCRDGQLT